MKIINTYLKRKKLFYFDNFYCECLKTCNFDPDFCGKWSWDLLYQKFINYYSLVTVEYRYRPDIRKLENNDLDGAASEKNRLEEKQREVRSLRKRKKLPEWTPRYV